MLTRFKERVSGVLGRGPSLEERYQQAIVERQREMQEDLGRKGKLMEVDLTPGKGLFFGDRLGKEDEVNIEARDRLASAIGLLGEAISEKRKAKLYKAIADLRGTRIWGERYQELNMDAPITLSQREKDVLEVHASLIDAFEEQKAEPIPRTQKVVLFDAFSRRPEDIPLVNIEAEMVCFSVTNTLTALQELREKKIRAGEKRALSLAKSAVNQVRSLKSKEDRVKLLDTLVKLNIRTEELEKKLG